MPFNAVGRYQVRIPIRKKSCGFGTLLQMLQSVSYFILFIFQIGLIILVRHYKSPI
jgi:hypothetical protein